MTCLKMKAHFARKIFQAWNNILLRKSVEFSSALLPNLWNE